MNNWKGNFFAKRYRFAVVDLDRSKSYPANYVCMLPINIWNDTRNASAFSKIFGDKSLGLAKQLLAETLEVATDPETKEEIERRLRELKMRSVKQVSCSSQGTIDQGDRNRRLPTFK